MVKKGIILVNKYEIGRMLGQGHFAKVYHARNLQTGGNVAMKVIDKEKITKVDLHEQIKREISVMRLCHHPNIVELYEVIATKSKIYLAMEYLKGGELFARLVKGRLREDVARKYFQQLIAAIDFCHSRGVYHRDLKPENLLLDEMDNLKVMDFGLSALAESKRTDGLLHTACGTPSYVAPEVIKRKGYDGAKADIWSCGIILFVLLAGYLPFYDKNIMSLYRKIAKGEVKYPSWFSSQVKRLLRKLLDPNPCTRASVAEVMKDDWFKEGFKKDQPPPQPDLNVPEESPRSVLDFEQEWDNCSVEPKPEMEGGMKPTSLNAFNIISLSPCLNLSGLFDEDMSKKHETRFTVRKPSSTIVSRLKNLAMTNKFRIKNKDGIVEMQSFNQGRKGQLTIDAEIFEIAPLVHLVEVTKTSGDTIEYKKFCDQELRPSLKDIVWTQ